MRSERIHKRRRIEKEGENGGKSSIVAVRNFDSTCREKVPQLSELSGWIRLSGILQLPEWRQHIYQTLIDDVISFSEVLETSRDF